MFPKEAAATYCQFVNIIPQKINFKNLHHVTHILVCKSVGWNIKEQSECVFVTAYICYSNLFYVSFLCVFLFLR